jgi:sigma-B regulation protein RsbU (phosphoserine phosphatase)
VKLAWNFRPCEELAGDFLNVLPLDKRHLALYVADVSGHGVVASLLSVTISHTLTAQNSTSSLLKRQKPDSSETEIVSPSEVVKELNERFPMEDSGGTYFTLVYGILDVQTREFRYISAGHPPIVRLPRDAEPEFLKAGGFAVGWETDFDYDEYVVRLESGDRLCIYSDGVPEALNSQLESFTDKRMLEVLRRNRSEDLHTATENLLKAVEQWCGESQPKDDVSILALEVE